MKTPFVTAVLVGAIQGTVLEKSRSQWVAENGTAEAAADYNETPDFQGYAEEVAADATEAPVVETYEEPEVEKPVYAPVKEPEPVYTPPTPTPAPEPAKVSYYNSYTPSWKKAYTPQTKVEKSYTAYTPIKYEPKAYVPPVITYSRPPVVHYKPVVTEPKPIENYVEPEPAVEYKPQVDEPEEPKPIRRSTYGQKKERKYEKEEESSDSDDGKKYDKHSRRKYLRSYTANRYNGTPQTPHSSGSCLRRMLARFARHRAALRKLR